MRRKYELGAAGFVDLSASRSTLFDARSSLTRAKYNLALQKNILDYTTGSIPLPPYNKTEHTMAKKKNTAKTKRYLTIATGAAAAVVLLASLFIFREKPIEVTVEPATRKEIVHIVTATGKIQPETDVAISPDVSGEIIELPVKEGQSVEKGTLLFKIQPDVYFNQVEQSQAQLNQARSQSLEARSRQFKQTTTSARPSCFTRKNSFPKPTICLQNKCGCRPCRISVVNIRHCAEQKPA